MLCFSYGKQRTQLDGMSLCSKLCIQQYEKGGLKTIDVKSVISALQHLTLILRIKGTVNQAYFNNFNYHTQKYGDAFLLNCNFDTDLLKTVSDTNTT